MHIQGVFCATPRQARRWYSRVCAWSTGCGTQYNALHLLRSRTRAAGILAATAAPYVGAADAFDCSVGCPVVLHPVCGANGVSYMSACVAQCSGKQRSSTPGYCAGVGSWS